MTSVEDSADRRRRIAPLAALLALAVCSSAARGQSSGGVSGVDGRRIRPGTDSLAIYLVRGGDTTRTGVVRDEITVDRSGARPLLRRAYYSADRAIGTVVDTATDDLETLAPVRERSRTDRSAEFLDFEPGRVRGWLRLANGDSVPVDAGLPAAVYRASAVDLVLRAAPLAEGWSADVPAFMSSTRTVAPLHARVAALETVEGEPCWRVDAEFAGLPVSFWIARDSRALRRQLRYVRNGVQVLIRSFPASP